MSHICGQDLSSTSHTFAGMSHTPAPSIRTDATPTDAGGTEIALSWDELRAVVTATGDGLYLATVGADGRPHVTYVSAGWADERLWISVFDKSRKAANLRTRPEVAMTCPPSLELNLLIRADARLVTDVAETRQLWDAGVLPYDPGMFFGGPEDPNLQFVELRPTMASIHPLGPGPTRRWRRT